MTRTHTKFFKFHRLAFADGASTVLRIAMVCNDLVLANSLLGQYKEMKPDILSHVRSSPLLTALEEVQQSVDVIHRNHSKCAWLMDDGTWFAIRKYAPSAARPLDFDKGDSQYAYAVNCGGYLLGKPVLICNDLAGSNDSPGSAPVRR